MISTADDQGDALWNSHSDNFSLMRKIHSYTERFRRNKRDRMLHRTGGNTTFSWEYSTICNKCHQFFFFQLFSDCLLIFSEKNGLFQFFLIYVFVKESVFYTGRKKIEQNLFQFGCINGTAICRKTNKKSGSDAFGCDFTCGSGKDFLSTVADGNQTAFTRTFCTEGIVVYLLFKLARQMVGKGDTCEIVFAVGIRKTGIFAGNMDTDVGGRCKRISLYMVDGKDIMPKLVTAFQRFVGGITFSVDGLKLLF